MLHVHMRCLGAKSHWHDPLYGRGLEHKPGRRGNSYRWSKLSQAHHTFTPVEERLKEFIDIWTRSH